MEPNQNESTIMVEYDTPMKGQRYIQECKEQIQEDILTYLSVSPRSGARRVQEADDLCQIVVDNFKTLEK